MENQQERSSKPTPYNVLQVPAQNMQLKEYLKDYSLYLQQNDLSVANYNHNDDEIQMLHTDSVPSFIPCAAASTAISRSNTKSMLRNSTDVENDKLTNYKIISEIGRGARGVVYKVQNQAGHVFALKKITTNVEQKSNQQDDELNKEVSIATQSKQARILRSLNHQFVIKYKNSFFEDNSINILMEFAEGGDLQNVSYKHYNQDQIINQQKLKRRYFSEKDIWEIAWQIALAVLHLHAHDVIHRDIKCSNIFISNKRVKLGDLGESHLLSNSKFIKNGSQNKQPLIGTPLFMSPEMIKLETYDHRVDVWALGCVIYNLSTLETPFSGQNVAQLFQNIQFKKPKSFHNYYSGKLTEFILTLLHKKKEQRPFISEVIDLFPQKFKLEDEIDIENYNFYKSIEKEVHQKKLSSNLELINKEFNKLKNRIFKDQSIVENMMPPHLLEKKKSQAEILRKSKEMQSIKRLNIHHQESVKILKPPSTQQSPMPMSRKGSQSALSKIPSNISLSKGLESTFKCMNQIQQDHNTSQINQLNRSQVSFTNIKKNIALIGLNQSALHFRDYSPSQYNSQKPKVVVKINNNERIRTQVVGLEQNSQDSFEANTPIDSNRRVSLQGKNFIRKSFDRQGVQFIPPTRKKNNKISLKIETSQGRYITPQQTRQQKSESVSKNQTGKDNFDSSQYYSMQKVYSTKSTFNETPWSNDLANQSDYIQIQTGSGQVQDLTPNSNSHPPTLTPFLPQLTQKTKKMKILNFTQQTPPVINSSKVAKVQITPNRPPRISQQHNSSEKKKSYVLKPIQEHVIKLKNKDRNGAISVNDEQSFLKVQSRDLKGNIHSSQSKQNRSFGVAPRRDIANKYGVGKMQMKESHSYQQQLIYLNQKTQSQVCQALTSTSCGDTTHQLDKISSQRSRQNRQLGFESSQTINFNNNRMVIENGSGDTGLSSQSPRSPRNESLAGLIKVKNKLSLDATNQNVNIRQISGGYYSKKIKFTVNDLNN